MKALLRVLKYIKLSPGQGLHFSTHKSFKLKAFCDGDWPHVLLQEGLSLSMLFSRPLSHILDFKEANSCLKVNVPTHISILCDNESAIALASNLVQHARTKHIKLDCHFAREKIKSNHILSSYIPTRYKVADF
ncbi:hypothetical protein Tco_1137235 [Tanacetum coccineum]